MSYIKSLRLGFMVLVLFTLVACGGGGDKSSGDLPATGTAVGGYVIDGPISGSSVTLNRINNDGSVGEQVAGPFMTDANGQWNGTIPDNVTGTLVVVATGGQYTDDVTGDVIVLAANESLNSWFDTTSPDIKGVVSPVTDSLWQVIEQGLNKGDTLDASVATAERIATDFWGVDPTRTLPDVTSNTAVNQRYGAILGGYSFLMENRAEFQQEPFVSMNRFTLMRLIMDDMADGKLDGIAIDGSQISATGGVPFPALSANDLSAFFSNVNEFASERQVPPLDQSYFESYPPIFDCTPVTCPTFSIGGNVTGLSGSLVLQNNLGDDLTVNANSSFSFSAKLSSGAGYNVTVLSAPPSQDCSVTSGAVGTVNGADISNVQVSCSDISSPTYTIGGNVTGLNGTLILQNNGGDSKTIETNGGFEFSAALQSGSAYDIKIFSSPVTQNCSVTTGATGTIGSANISNVQVVCSNLPTYTIGGSVTGLDAVNSVVLQNNGGDDVTVNGDGNGNFTFNTELLSGVNYEVTVSGQPNGQSCTVEQNGSGSIAAADVNNIVVSCSLQTYTLSGKVVGLNGTITLKDRSSLTNDYILLTENADYTFPKIYETGTAYDIYIWSGSPAEQNCTLENMTGTVSNSNITNVNITCIDKPTYTVGGTVSGLDVGGGALKLRVYYKSVTEKVSVTEDGSYVFTTQYIAGDAYRVYLDGSPRAKECTFDAGFSGRGEVNVTDVNITCNDISGAFSIGGTVTGLAGTLELTGNYFTPQIYDSGPVQFSITANGEYKIFPEVYDKDRFAVKISGQPTGQQCYLTNGSGQIKNGYSATNIDVECFDYFGYYPAAEKWSYFVVNDGTTDFDANNIKCTVADTGEAGCIHGGIMRVIDVPGGTCLSLTAVDQLDALNWVCNDDAGQARFISTGLKENKRLYDLVELVPGSVTMTQAYEGGDPPAMVYGQGRWKLNSLIVSNGYTSPEARWWINDVRIDMRPMFDSAKTGGIYLNEPDAVYAFTKISGDGSYNGINGNKGSRSYYITGDHASIAVDPTISLPARGTDTYFITHSSDFNWIEGSFTSHAGSANNQVNQNAITSGSRFSKFRYFTINNIGQYGMTASGSNNTYQHIYLNSISAGLGAGVGFGLKIDANDSRFYDIKVINNDFGLMLTGDSNTIKDGVFANTNRDGINITGNDNILLNITSANNTESGIFLNDSLGGADNNLLMNVATIDNNQHGIDALNTAGLSLLNIATANNGNSGINFLNSFVNADGTLMVGTNGDADCAITNSTGLATDCTAAGLVLTAGLSLKESFVNPVTRDYSLKSSLNLLRAVFPVNLDGSNTFNHTWSDASTTMFLQNATEITGNGNGLCESDETCLFTPNIGAYQGHGNLISADTFVDGDLTGIKLMQYETNGY